MACRCLPYCHAVPALSGTELFVSQCLMLAVDVMASHPKHLVALPGRQHALRSKIERSVHPHSGSCLPELNGRG
ncbi:hypothetical protein HYDPIDRAFT_109292 [Hydnomerulius pinastri MD-312]|nr:hypothetical protein HYDPIDRAFT_109292 [Hydnomerulius pinastri MD-312]